MRNGINSGDNEFSWRHFLCPQPKVSKIAGKIKARCNEVVLRTDHVKHRNNALSLMNNHVEHNCV